jgi:hypothetical protein
MKNIFCTILLSLIMLPYCSVAQNSVNSNSINQVTKDSRGNDMLIGKCTKDALMTAPFNAWYTSNYDAYKVDSFTCTYIKPLLADKSITIFMGTWCGDSQREVPRILKMLECCGFPQDMLTLIMVSNKPEEYKQSPQHEEQGKNIVRVPTIIIEEKGAEVGRIIEYPVVSLEKDLLAILSKGNYTPNYHSPKTTGR